MKKIRVGAVSYLNTKPLLYGIHHNAGFLQQIELIEDYPSSIAQQLINDEIDIGLVPVAIIPQLKAYHIVTDFCIGATGEVASVCLFSDVPIQQVEKVLLDYQSRTSVALTKVLLKNYWKFHPVLEDAKADFRNHISGTTAGLVIGDRAFEQRKQSAFVYDLAGAWITYTGLPFVFAAWIANKKLPEEFLQAFNQVNAIGLQQIDKVIAELSSPHYDLKTYFTKNISYTLNNEKRKGLERFLSEMKSVIKF